MLQVRVLPRQPIIAAQPGRAVRWPARSASGWDPARWSTAAHRALEDATLGLLSTLQARPGSPIPDETVMASLTADLGADQPHAVRVFVW
ncbi:MAG TPA: hypothetical protein VKD67_12660 [Acidimicrobiales bacterium]|nr:hypothetical protein [Acidimicrobiales bacterium]